MKLKALLILIFFVTFSVKSQIAKDSIYSKIMGKNRVYSIDLPKSYNTKKDKKYPIMILLDGDYLTEPFSGAIKYGNYWDDLPEMILVGIHQNVDFERENDCYMDQNGIPIKTGIKFFDFINLELLPFIEKNYRVAPVRTVVGHGLTAGYINLFLMQVNPVFNAYISMSPELGPQMLERVPTQLSKFIRPVFYYQSTADGDLKENVEDVKILDESIKAIENKNLHYRYDDFKNTSHYSSVLFSVPNALYNIYGDYKPISMKEYDEKISVLEGDYVGYLRKKYETIDKGYGIAMPIRYTDFLAIETIILKKKDYKSLQELAELAKKSYPKGLLSDYYMGLMYENMGDNKRALKYYADAYQLQPVGDVTKDIITKKTDEMKAGMPKKSK